MSGGLHPCPKYEQVVADDCWPIKLSTGLGVDVADELADESGPLTPPVALTSEAGPLPFAQCGVIGLSSVEAAVVAAAVPRLAAETT
jgi:hypothetical protein